MDFVAVAFILVITILVIAILVMRRSGRQTRKHDRDAYRPNNLNNADISLHKLNVKEREGKDKPAEGRTIARESAPVQMETGMNRVNVGRIYGYHEDIFWDKEEHERFITECQKNGHLPQDAFNSYLKLVEDAAKIKVLLNEMIEIENDYDSSKSENVSRLELIRNIISRMYK